jgi:TetR/AcrR family transcriptional repressor of lmrAB and yxaGH operons
MQRWCELTAARLERSSYEEGCPVTAVAVEAPALTARVATACSAAFADWQSMLARRFELAGLKARRAAELAVIVLATFEGALLLARSSRSTRPLVLVGHQLAALVRSELSPPP